VVADAVTEFAARLRLFGLRSLRGQRKQQDTDRKK
jgi:hypothetical protein